MLLPLDWSVGEWVADAPAERDGDSPTTVVIVDADFPDGVVVRNVVDWTVDVGVEDVLMELWLDIVDVVLEVVL